jgi:hypothetical protein
MDSEKPVLTDPDVPPSSTSIKAALEGSYVVYKNFMHNISNSPLNLKEEWRYYRDGKAWLCKVTHKKKTVFWLSAYKDHFKTSFYFTLKNADDIAGLPISKKIRETFAISTPIGKLIPLTIIIKDEKHIPDVLKLVDYKISKL